MVGNFYYWQFWIEIISVLYLIKWWPIFDDVCVWELVTVKSKKNLYLLPIFYQSTLSVNSCPENSLLFSVIQTNTEIFDWSNVRHSLQKRKELLKYFSILCPVHLLPQNLVRVYSNFFKHAQFFMYTQNYFGILKC